MIKKRRVYVYIISGCIFIFLLILTAFVLYTQTRKNEIIPTYIKEKITFTIALPRSENYLVDKATLKYDEKTKVLSYVTRIKESERALTVSLQESPEVFHDAPLYPQLLESMGAYKELDSTLGEVSLTKPDSSSSSGGVAVANTKGMLIFVKSPHPLRDNEWVEFFNSLELF